MAIVLAASNDLRLRETPCDADKVISSGWSARSNRLGALAFWARYTLDRHRTRQFVAAVRKLTISKARQRRRREPKGDLHHLADAVSFWWLGNKCRTCQGRGFLVLENQQIVSNFVCDTCSGLGLQPTPTPADVELEWEDAEFRLRFDEVAAAIDAAMSSFLGAAVRSLRRR